MSDKPTALTAIFTATTAASGSEVWITDGTVAGTHQVADVNPGPAGSDPAPQLDGTVSREYTQLNATVYFSAGDANGSDELWALNETTWTPHLVANINGDAGGFGITGLTVLNNELVFAAEDPGTFPPDSPITDAGPQLYVSDGTTAGTFPLFPEVSDHATQNFSDFTVLGNRVFYLENVGGIGDGNLPVPFSTDGTAQGSYGLPINAVSTGGEANTPLTLFDGQLVYGATLFGFDADFNQIFLGDEIHSTNDASVPDPVPLPGSVPADLTASGPRLFFAGSGSGSFASSQLWVSTLAPGSTHQLTAFNPTNGFDPQDITAFAGGVLFQADDGLTGKELWFSNGTTAGTRLVADINPAGDSSPADIVTIGAEAFFTATDGTHGTELYETDGTAAGTRLVDDINPGSGSSNPTDLTVFGTQLLFSADDGTNGTQLWITDGTTTTRLTNDTSGSFDPRDLTTLTPNVITTWNGGRGSYGVAAQWTNGAPASGGTAYVPSGIVVAANQTLSGATVSLDAYAPQANRGAALGGATLALTGAVIAGSETVTVNAGAHPAAAGITVTGAATNDGQILVGAAGSASDSLTVTVSDIVSRSGATLAAGTLTNLGLIQSEGGTVIVRGTTTDTTLVNNATIADNGAMLLDIALAGNGAITLNASSGTATPTLELTRSVGAGQTIDLSTGALRLDDPTAFAGTINFAAINGSIELAGFVAASETFADGVLTLSDGAQTVALRLPGQDALTDFTITTGSGNTLISSAFAQGTVSVVTPIASPLALVGPNALPPVFTASGILSSGATTTYNQTLHGTILLGSANAASVPSVDIAQVTLAADSLIASNAAPASGTATPYATVNATGSNVNNGGILANSPHGQFRLTIADMRSSDGTVLESGSLQNKGTITASGDHLIVTGTATDTALVNSNAITATNGATIDLNVAVLGLGTITVAGGSTLTVGGSVGSQQTVDLDTGSSVNLGLANAQTFAGSIKDFGSGDTIKLSDQSFDIAGYAGGVLNLAGSSGTAALTVMGAGSTADFLVTHTGGSTLITHA